jgi:hypothetical protein
MTTFQEFCTDNALTMTAKYVGIRADKRSTHKPNTRELAEPWQHFLWACTLEYQGRTYTTEYRLGLGHCTKGRTHKVPCEIVTNDIARALKPYGRIAIADVEGYVTPTAPSLVDVLGSLTSDASAALHCRDFEDFCNEYGYDTDSRAAEKVYAACTQVHFELYKLLGGGLYETLLACSEE